MAPLYDSGLVGTTEERGNVLVIDCLKLALSQMFSEVRVTPRGIDGLSAAADLLVLVRPRIWVTIEGRNRRWEILDRLEDRDRAKFAHATRMGLPVVVVAPRVTKRYRKQLAEITNGLGRVVETGIYVAVTPTAQRTLEGWAVWPMMLYVPVEVLEAVRAEVVAAADRFEAADFGPQVLPFGMAASFLQDGGSIADAANTGPETVDGAVAGGVPLIQISDDEALEEIRRWRSENSGTQRDCGHDTGLGYHRVRRLWSECGDGRWTGWTRSSS